MNSGLKEYQTIMLKENAHARGEPFFSHKGRIFFGLCLIIFAVFMTSQSIMCDDFYWHISVGEWILENGQIPTTGIFSWTAANTPWFAHEWLAEIVIYWFSLLGAEFGGWLYFVVSVTLMFSLIYFMNIKEINKNYMAGLAAWIFLIISTKMISSARPHMLSMSFFIYLLYSLEQFRKDEKSKWIYFTPIISLIWANYHGGTVMFVPILFLIYICSGLFNFNFMKLKGEKLTKKQLISLLILFAVNMVAVCINPHGFHLITYPFSYSNVATKYISEWQPPSFTDTPFVMILIIVICIVLFLTKRKLSFTDLGVLGVLMIMTLVYVRFEWWLAVAMMFFIFNYIPAYNEPSYKKLKSGSLLFLLVAIFITFAPTYSIGLDDPYVSEEAIDVLKETEYTNLYNSYDAGNILIYHGFDVFLDGRSDMYQHVLSPDIYQDKESEDYDESKTISILEEAADFSSYNIYNMGDFIDKYELDLFLISKNSRCKFYLMSREDMEELYSDDNILIYKKTS